MSSQSDERRDGGGGAGTLYVVGIGPGSPLDRTRRAEEAIAASGVIVGYGPYLERIADLLEGKRQVVSGMRQERERVAEALRIAAAGETVALISSGDAGIYGMAGLALELAGSVLPRPRIRMIPGVTAACAAGAMLGAPLMLDYATISLSDLLVPWPTIRKRIELALTADFVIALYNPRSHTRTQPFDEMLSLAKTARAPSTPVGIATAMGQEDESVLLTTLGELNPDDVTMKSILILGNSISRIEDEWFLTPRGYAEKTEREANRNPA